MVEYSHSNVFDVSAQTMVNTVNCFGVMGAGLALEFKARYPKMYEEYARLCRKQEVKVGHLCLHQADEKFKIINFPTKKHWKYPSKIEWIETGLQYFLDNYQKWEIESVAFPKLGCDLGGLDWSDVDKIMNIYLSQIEDIEVIICLDEAEDQGIVAKMLEMINDPQCWQDQIKPNYHQKLQQCLPIKRFKNLQRYFKSSDYINIFNRLHELASEEKISLSPSQARLMIVNILQELNIPTEKMIELTWGDIVFNNDWHWLKVKGRDDVYIVPEKWSILRQIKGDSKESSFLLHDLKDPQKRIKISTLKKLLARSTA